LQTIRTLMERSAVYRRALAPVMIYCGVCGLAGGAVGDLGKFDSDRSFALVWTVTALVALGGSGWLMRRQALKDAEPFWSPPVRRIAQAVAPAFLVGGAIAGMLILEENETGPGAMSPVIGLWCVTFGCGVHAAGFFLPRGLRWFGWLFVLAGLALLVTGTGDFFPSNLSPQLLMAAIFGGLHLAYGVYLYFTEQKDSAV